MSSSSKIPNNGISRRGLAKGGLWSVPIVATAVNAPANAVSCDPTDSSMLTLTVISDPTTPIIEISNTSTDCAWVGDLQVNISPTLKYAYYNLAKSPVTVDGLNGPRAYDRLSTPAVYYHKFSLGSRTIEAGQTLTLPVASVTNTTTGFSSYTVNFSSGTYQADLTIYGLGNSETLPWTGNISISGSNILTVYGPHSLV
ncbi:MAG: hypothetical protein QM613_01025 [Micrococcaceae bacterium]